MKTKLFDNYLYDIIEDADLYYSYLDENRAKNFELDINFHPNSIYTDDEKEKLAYLKLKCSNRFVLRIFIYENDEIIGWSHGWQIEDDTFYMTNSAIEASYRNKGIYSSLLNHIITILKEKGFQKITSRHKTNNNPVIIPKLRAGFLISSFEISEAFGILVHLTYFFNETSKKVFDYRIGVLDNEEKINKMLIG